MQNSKPDGFHFLLEFFGCDVDQINDMEFWRTELHACIEGTSMESLHDFFFQFEPQGITGYLLLSSSHISIHTWPENGYVVCDVFTCSTEVETEQAVQHLKAHISHERVEVKKIQRGFKVSRKGGVVQDVGQCTLDRHCISLPVYSTGDVMLLDVLQTVVEIETALQKIQIVDTAEYGKCLIINGVLHSTEKDHYVYDRELIKRLRSSDKDILVLGGGDGYVARRIIAENPHAQVNVDVVDVDVEVVKACERYLGQDVFVRNEARIHIGDALHFLKMSKKKYDGIIFDMTKAPIGRTQEEQFVQFYEDLCALAYEHAKDSAWIAVQAGTTSVAEKYMDTSMILTGILHDTKWQNVDRSDVMIPSHGESYTFLFAQKTLLNQDNAIGNMTVEKNAEKKEQMKKITLPIFETGKNMEIYVKSVLYEKKSEYQDIKVIDTEEFGRCLIINESMQTAEKDHKLYDRAILSMMRPEDSRLIILGGGDGYVAQEALERNPDIVIELVELDPEIIHCAKEHLGQNVFENPHVKLKIGDGLAYIKEKVEQSEDEYDGLVCDFTGEPITEKEKKEFVDFFTKVIGLSYDVVRDGGWVAFQSGDSDVDLAKYVDTVGLMEKMMKEKFTDVSRKDVMIPSYGERDGFIFGWKK